MAKKKSEPTAIRTAFEKAKEARDAAKEKAEKQPNNETLKKAVEHAQTQLATAAKNLRRENYTRLGKSRFLALKKALKGIRALSSRTQYEYGQEDFDILRKALNGQLDTVITAFEAQLASGGKAETTEATPFD